MIRFCYISAIMCLLCTMTVGAQEKTVTNTKMVGVGYQALQDTYLSPEHYHGVEMRYISNTARENDSTRWARLILNEGWLSSTNSRSKKGGILSGAYTFRYGIVKTWKLMDDKLRLQAGGMGEIILGAIYNTRAGNNAVNVRSQLNIGPVVRAQYKLGKYYLTYEASTPLCGLAFSPNYGQSYYEISEGNYDRNVVPTSFLSVPSLRHQLTFTMPFTKNYRLTAGYLGDYRQQGVNSLKQHIYTHMFIIGLTVKR